MDNEQLGLFAPPRRLFTCTPSKLASYQDCPRRYRFTYVDRPSPPKGPPWAHNTLGARVHAALRRWWALPSSAATGAAAATAERRLGQRGLPRRRAVERGALPPRARLADYVAGLDPHDEPVGVERTVAARTERLALSGRVDRIDQRGDELVIVDYKTGRAGSPPTTPAAHRRSRCTSLGVRRTLRRPAAGSSCTTCPAARSPRSSTPTTRWPGTCAGPRPPPRTSPPRPTRWPPGPTADEAFPAAPGRAVRVVRLPAVVPGGGGGRGEGSVDRGGPCLRPDCSRGLFSAGRCAGCHCCGSRAGCHARN